MRCAVSCTISSRSGGSLTAPASEKLAGIRFFYRHVLGQENFSLRVPAKRSGRLPKPLSRGEIGRLLEAATNPKHRALLMTTYGGGLPAETFLDRFLQHVLPDRFMRIRHYGLLAN